MIDHVQDSAYLDVDRHGVLRVPGTLWLGFSVLARYWLLVLAVTVGVVAFGFYLHAREKQRLRDQQAAVAADAR